MERGKEIIALVRLLDDPDEGIYRHVRDELMHHGKNAIPFLESSWEEEDYGLAFQSRIEELIHDIQFEAVKDELTKWRDSENKNLLDGWLIVCLFQYPNLDEKSIREKIEAIQKDIWLEISHRHTAYEKIRIFNKIFYGKYHFTGNSKDYHSPLNSFLNTVLETHKGNPLSLSLLYSIIAQKLEMPVYGINLPNHFVLSYLDLNNVNAEIDSSNEHGVLFYINAFSKGGIFDENEIKDFLKGLNLPFNREYFEPCSNTTIIVRMLTNLISSFQQVGNAQKVNELMELRELFNFKF